MTASILWQQGEYQNLGPLDDDYIFKAFHAVSEKHYLSNVT